MKRLSVVLLLFLLAVTTSLQGVFGVSETLQLIPEAYIVKGLELQKNDRLEGSFNISTLYSYKSLLDGKNYTYWVVVDFQDPESHTVLKYPKLEDNLQYSFNLTADSSGLYTIRFFCSFNYFPPKAIVPQLTIEYTVLEATPLKINVLSPSNQTYNESSLSLNFTLNKPVNSVSYSLDRKDNVTIDGNTTLTGLSNGLHNIIVYANNTFGKASASDTINFTVAKPEPYPTSTVAVLVVVGVVVVVGGLLAYFKKRKR